MSVTGTVKRWVAGKGFGFIEAQDGSGDMFVHFRQIQGGRKTLNEGENVTYSVGQNPKTGRPVAENVVGDGTGTPAAEGGQSGFGGRGSFVSRGGSAAHGGGRGVCYAFQKGQCNFGDRCRYSHGAESGYGRGVNSQYGARGMGGGRGGQAMIGGQGMVSYGNVAAQAAFSSGQGHPTYGQNGCGGRIPETNASYGQQGLGMFANQGGGRYAEQSFGGYAQQGTVSAVHGQHSGTVQFNQQGMNNSYQQQGAGGFTSRQLVGSDRNFSQQGSLATGSMQYSAAQAVATNDAQLQRGNGTGYIQQGYMGKDYGNGKSYSQQY